MTGAEDLRALEWAVIALGLAIGLVLGWISRYAGFCTMGAINDWRSSGDTSRLRMWLLAITVAMAATQAMAIAGLIDTKDSFYIAPRVMWLSNIIGGLMFGLGMVLASGCGGRTLVRIGGGSLKAVVVFLVMAIFAYMTMRGIFAVLRASTVDQVNTTLSGPQDLSSIIGMPRAIVATVVAATLAIVALANREFLGQPRYIVTGLVIGLLVAGGWFVTGNIGFIAEDPLTLEPRFLATNTRSIESLTFVAPLAYWLDLLMLFSDKSRSLTFGIATVSGVAAGAFIHALASKSFRLEGFADRGDLARHLIGAALMGIGGVTAMGCTIGQGISGLSLMALGSLLATVSIVAGAWLGLGWLERHA